MEDAQPSQAEEEEEEEDLLASGSQQPQSLTFQHLVGGGMPSSQHVTYKHANAYCRLNAQ
eukprot:1161838-Pelagomonas_calceolata.AAC.7